VQRSEQRIITTHAGSLPRPDDLTELLYEVIDERPVDQARLDERVREAVRDAVQKQREAGVDVISDGEMGKVGFSNYVLQRFGGFTARAQFMALDVAETPALAGNIFGDRASQHLRLPILEGPMEPRGRDAIAREIEDLRAALGDTRPDDAFIGAVTPGQITFNFPNRFYGSHEAYLDAAARALRPEYEAIVEAGFNLQLDSPDVAMACHCWTEGSDLKDAKAHIPASIEALNGVLGNLPSEKIRFHVCWGNYRGPHHKDVALRDIVDPVLRIHADFIYFEAANPRHEHEWEVWKDVKLPDDKALIPGVIDTKTNHVEHPELVAQRLERFAGIVGRERVIAGTDCGFATFVGWHSCEPESAWLKLRALSDGAALASRRLW
jgi:5-methyltetrahydropteroyltriglutamate--homocysteine methyltransferase